MDARELAMLLHRLEGMPAWVAVMAERFDASMATRAPADGGFSLVEHLWHLTEMEDEAYADRLRRVRRAHTLAVLGSVQPDEWERTRSSVNTMRDTLPPSSRWPEAEHARRRRAVHSRGR